MQLKEIGQWMKVRDFAKEQLFIKRIVMIYQINRIKIQVMNCRILNFRMKVKTGNNNWNKKIMKLRD